MACTCTCRETQLVLFGEILEKIRILNLVLKPCECRHEENCQNSIQLTVNKEDISVLRGLFKTEISFEGFTVQPLSAQSVTIVNKEEFHLRLQITSTATSTPSQMYGELDFNKQLLTDAKQQRVLNIRCKKCLTAVTHINRTFCRVLELPTENWHEYLDNWCCHGNDAISKLKGSLNPQSQDCFLGNWYIVVHTEAVDVKNIEIIKEDDAQLVLCKRCRAIVGELSFPAHELINSECRHDGGESVKLYKYSVSLIVNIDGTPLDMFRDFGEESYLSRKFLTLIESCQCRKFIMNGRKKKRGVKAPCYALLWILNTDAKFLTSRCSNEGCGESTGNQPSVYCQKDNKEIFSALKVLYRSYLYDNFASVKEQWYSDAQTDIIIFPDEICLKLLLMLNRNSKLQPPSMRQANGLQVSFLKLQTT